MRTFSRNATFIEERWLDGFGGDSKGRINRIIEMKMGREEVYKCKRQRVPGNAAQEMRKRSNENNGEPQIKPRSDNTIGKGEEPDWMR